MTRTQMSDDDAVRPPITSAAGMAPPSPASRPDCAEAACSSRKDMFAAMSRQRHTSSSDAAPAVAAAPECPLFRDELGRASWGLARTHRDVPNAASSGIKSSAHKSCRCTPLPLIIPTIPTPWKRRATFIFLYYPHLVAENWVSSCLLPCHYFCVIY